MRLKLSELAAAAGSALAPGDDSDVTAVATDSRAVRPGTLFVCLAGEHVDGHDYALKAQDAGAAAIMPQGAPIGSHKGLAPRDFIPMIRPFRSCAATAGSSRRPTHTGARSPLWRVRAMA